MALQTSSSLTVLLFGHQEEGYKEEMMKLFMDQADRDMAVEQKPLFVSEEVFKLLEQQEAVPIPSTQQGNHQLS